MSLLKHFDFDIIVIGSGAGGSGAASIAAKNNKKTAIIEADAFGGDSPNWSDIPIKSMLHAAQLLDNARLGSRFGLRTNTIGYNFPSLKNWKDLAIKRTGAGGNRKYYENQGIAAFNSKANFLSPNEISVGRHRISAKNFIVATGSKWIIPEIQGLSTINYYTPKTILNIVRPPKSLFIIGGGSSGVEMAQLFAVFGTKVYISEIASRILPQEDEEVGILMEKLLSNSKGISILTQSKVMAVSKEGLYKKVIFNRGEYTKSIKVDEVLVATGRRPEIDLGLDNASIEYSNKGIEVNDYLQTSAKHIYATGDVLGRNGQTYSALLESRVAINNILHKSRIKPDYTAISRLIFTNPEIASVGLSEDDCDKRDLKIIKSLVPLNMIARSNTSDFSDGFVKIITNKKKVILGATIVSPHASEMIHELALAIKYNMTSDMLAQTPHAFLSWSESIKLAAAKIK